jgi:hypothetical protein
MNAELRDLGSYKTAARFLKITCVVCSILTAIGAFLAGTEKTVLFVPPQHNRAVGLAFLAVPAAAGVSMSIFGHGLKAGKK